MCIRDRAGVLRLEMAGIVHLGGDVTLLTILRHFPVKLRQILGGIFAVGELITLARRVTVSAIDRRRGAHAMHRLIQHRRIDAGMDDVA